MSSIKSNIIKIKKDIFSNKYPLLSKKIDLICVSKNQSVENIRLAIEAGQIDFAENYVQEAYEKWLLLKAEYPQVRLHLIGNLQTNKIKKVLQIFDVIHTLDSIELVRKIAYHLKMGEYSEKKFLIQVFLDEDNFNKHGVRVGDFDELFNECKALEINITGVMAILPQLSSLGGYLAFLYQIKNKYNLQELSCGMSSDYLSAIRFGSTMIRIGQGIFGKRS